MIIFSQLNHNSGSDFSIATGGSSSLSSSSSSSLFTSGGSSGGSIEIPSGSYLPVAPPPQKINLPPPAPPSNHYGPPQPVPQYRPQTSYGPPPSGNIFTSHGSSHSSSGLAIQHGTVSGNLKPWHVQGEAPRKPIPFTQPLPQGLIESIGETVKQIDQHSSLSGGYSTSSGGYSSSSGYSGSSGYEIQASHDASGGLYSLPLEKPARPFYNPPQALSQELQLPIEQAAFFHGQGNTDCNHGLPQDSYGPPPSGRHQLSASSEVSQNVVSSYIPPPSGIVHHSESSSSGYQSASSEQVTHEVLPEASELRAAQSESSSSSSDDGHFEIRKSNEKDLPPLTSDSISVQGKLGSYQLQFQSANGLGDSGDNNSVDGATHQQLLSEGLLQQILSAIEQPNQHPNIPQSSYDQLRDHREAAAFLHSPDGQAIIAEKKSSTTK